MRDNKFAQYDHGGQPPVHIIDGEPSVVLGTKQQMAPHVDSPHSGGGQIAQGSATVLVGPKQLPFAREGDPTTDQLFVKDDVQPDVFIGGAPVSAAKLMTDPNAMGVKPSQLPKFAPFPR